MPAHTPPAANGGSDRTDDGDELFTLDAVLQCLVHPERRQILYVLQDEPITTEGDLARHLVEREHGRPVDELPAAESERIRVALRQHHLPQLDDARVLEYDRRSETIRYTDPPKLLDFVLRFFAHLEENTTS